MSTLLFFHDLQQSRVPPGPSASPRNSSASIDPAIFTQLPGNAAVCVSSQQPSQQISGGVSAAAVAVGAANSTALYLGTPHFNAPSEPAGINAAFLQKGFSEAAVSVGDRLGGRNGFCGDVAADGADTEPQECSSLAAADAGVAAEMANAASPQQAAKTPFAGYARSSAARKRRHQSAEAQVPGMLPDYSV